MPIVTLAAAFRITHGAAFADAANTTASAQTAPLPVAIRSEKTPLKPNSTTSYTPGGKIFSVQLSTEFPLNGRRGRWEHTLIKGVSNKLYSYEVGIVYSVKRNGSYSAKEALIVKDRKKHVVNLKETKLVNFSGGIIKNDPILVQLRYDGSNVVARINVWNRPSRAEISVKSVDRSTDFIRVRLNTRGVKANSTFSADVEGPSTMASRF